MALILICILVYLWFHPFHIFVFFYSFKSSLWFKCEWVVLEHLQNVGKIRKKKYFEQKQNCASFALIYVCLLFKWKNFRKKLYSVFLQHYILKIFLEDFFSAAAFTIKDCRDYYTMLSKSPYIWACNLCVFFFPFFLEI